MTKLMGLLCCILCQKAGEDLDPMLLEYQYMQPVWSYFLQKFGIQIAGQRTIRTRLEEFLLHPPLKEKGWILQFAGVCAVVWDTCRERNKRVFRGLEKNPYGIWSLVRFHVSI